MPLQDLKVELDTGVAGDSGTIHKASRDVRHPVVADFISSFSRNPQQAIAHLQCLNQVKKDPTTLATIFYKTPELDQEHISRFMSNKQNHHILTSFVERLPLKEIRIDEAVRILLHTIRLPAEAMACEKWLQALAHHWQRSNSMDRQLGIEIPVDLVWQTILSIMQLNDSLHPGSSFGFAFPNPGISQKDFLQAFAMKDPHQLISHDTLVEIFSSIRKKPLTQALPTSQNHLIRPITLSGLQTPISITLPRVPVNKWSDPIYITIPAADPSFEIELLGAGLVFDRPVLRFKESREVGFRVMGMEVGVREVVFHRCGLHA